MHECWVKNCTEEPFIEIEEIWFEEGSSKDKLCTSKKILRGPSPWMCHLHYMSRACEIATNVLTYAYYSHIMGEVIPTKWFVLYKEPNYVVEGDIHLERITKEELEEDK